MGTSYFSFSKNIRICSLNLPKQRCIDEGSYDIRESIKSDNFEKVKKNYLKIHGKYEKA